MDFESQFIQIGNVQIRYYGIIIVAAMLAATLVAARLAKRVKQDPEHVYGALTWAIIPGIIFARLWFVFFPPQTLVDAGQDTAWYFEHFFNTDNGAIAIWSGGLSIFGAVLGGLLGAYIYVRRNKLQTGLWLDLAAVVLPLGQAIGRWANYINQELFGKPTDLPWGISIPRDTIVENFPQYSGIEYFNTKFHPLFLYESLWSIVAFFVLLWLFNNWRNRFLPGDFFLIYVAQYSFIRFLLEFLRVEVTMVGDINLSQLVTAVLFVASVGLLLYRHRPGVSQSGYQIVEAPPAEKKKEEPEVASAT
jgi:phosphatidylglycerol:prolipoprotein diacylglycerol transferase